MELSKEKFIHYKKELEFRYNHREEDIWAIVSKPKEIKEFKEIAISGL